MSIDISATASGPLFDGRAPQLMQDLAQDVAEAVAIDANREVHRLLDTNLRHPTGYYESHVTLDRRVDDLVVHDQGVVYGPWLEGSSTRNRTTRFKGYSSFRRAAQEVESRIEATTEPVVARYVDELNGP